MRDERAARRYAKALFDTALAHNMVASVEDDLAAIDQLIQNDAEVRFFFESPSRSGEEKSAIAEKVFGDRITALTMQLLRVVLEKGREGEFSIIKEVFVDLRREHAQVVSAHISSAYELDKSQQDALVTKLSNGLGKKIEAQFAVDASLVGGVRIAYDDFVLDGSVRGAFKRLREGVRQDLKQ